MRNFKGNLEITLQILHVHLPRMFTIYSTFSVFWFQIVLMFAVNVAYVYSVESFLLFLH